jgi:radical SAM protein with 4Fe4S-binding SPASM domain
MTQFENINYLMIETNSSCNLSCTWCNRERLVAEGQRELKNITKEDFKKLLDVFKNCPIDTVKLEGLSEPFLHPEFDVMAKTLKDYFPKAFVIVATNCQYNLEKTKFLQTIPYVDMVYLSVDGIGDTFEKIRTGASFAKLIKTFEALATHLNSSERSKKLFINFTATEENFQDLPEIYALKDKYGFAGVRINLVQNWNEDEVNQHEFSQDFLSMIQSYKNDLKGVPGWEYSECFWPFSGIVVDVFGNIRQCVINTSQKPLGNVFTDDVATLFNHGSHYQEVREKLQNNCAPDACKNCDYHHHSSRLQNILGARQSQNTPRKFQRCP